MKTAFALILLIGLAACASDDKNPTNKNEKPKLDFVVEDLIFEDVKVDYFVPYELDYTIFFASGRFSGIKSEFYPIGSRQIG
ncbi:MAG: hypothetical protein HRT57_08140 [Crocinitomicaceae bacterium]|nr:hypothetical protein [Crocinitomicaceae bacterium]